MCNTTGGQRSLQRTRVAFAVLLSFCSGWKLAHANPTGPTVINGQVSFTTAGQQLSIINSPGSIINWQRFSIGANELTRFIQQSPASAVLNRVTGGDPSMILGALQSNGRVFLINPAGITFGAGAQINSAGLVASTLALSDADFLGNRYRFSELPKSGAISNQGTIAAADGGRIYLVASSVTNSGIIRSDTGEILLAAGRSVELVDAASPEVRVQINAPDNQVLNVGQVLAKSGRIGIYGGLIRQGGIVNADTAVPGANGKIVFKATKDVTLEANSITSATGAQGGTITIEGQTGTTLVAGSVMAAAKQGAGGDIQLLGNQVGLTGAANIDASGSSGGGTVLVGGDRHGDNPAVKNAWRTYLGPEVTVKADAVDRGIGGKIIVWADDTTRFYGSVSARGGGENGNGGFAEISGKQFLLYRGSADLGAARGAAGVLLLDPRDITIQSAGTNDSDLLAATGTLQNGTTPQVAGQILFADTGATDFTLTDAAINASNADIVLQAQRDINVNAPVMLASDRDFIAQAGRDINVLAALTTTGMSAGKGNIHLEADSPHSSGAFDGAGRVNINAAVNACGGSTGGCAGGAITLIGGADSSPGGGFNLNANVQAGDGGIKIALSDTASVARNFSIGTGGSTQLNSSDTGSLLSTGPLMLGTAATAGADGYGSRALPLLVSSLSQLSGNPMNFSAASGSSFTLRAGAGGISLDRALTTFSPTVIDTTGPFTLNAAITTVNGDLFINANSLAIAGTITAGARARVTSDASIQLNAGSSLSAGAAGDALILSGSTFINNAGSTAVAAPAGRWLIWSGDPAFDNRGGLAYNFKQYNAAYGVSPVLGAGNGFLYTVAPRITPQLTGTVSKVYDGTTAAALIGGNYTLTGTIDGDTASLNKPATGTYDTRNVGSGKMVAVTGIGITGANNGAAIVYGYQLASTSASGSIGTISPAALTLNAVTDQKSYDGTTRSTAVVGSAGLAAGDTVNPITQSFQSKDVLGLYGSTLAIDRGFVVNDGNGGNNYVITLNSARGTIVPATVNLAATRPDNGTADFIAGAFDAVLSGMVGRETLTVASGAGSVPVSSIGTQRLATGSLALGDGTNGGLAANYTLAGGAHTGTILAGIAMPPPVTTPIVEASGNYIIYAATNAVPVNDKVTKVEPRRQVSRQAPKQLPNCR